MPEKVIWIMVILVSFAVGFLCGWLLEYYLDLKYWEVRARRRGLPPAPEDETAAVPAIERYRDEIETYEQLVATQQELLSRYEAELHALRRDISRPRARYDERKVRSEPRTTFQADDLTAIAGIVRLYQWKLYDAGISTYEQLASTTPERLHEILETTTWREIDPASWIEQAKVLAQRGKG